MAKKRLIQFLALFLILAPLAVLADFVDFTLLWSRVYDSSRDDFIFDLDAKSNIHIAGYTYNGSNNDYLIMKYNNQGDLLWQKTYDGGYGNDSYGDRGQGIAVDAGRDDVYVTGNSATNDYSRVGTLKYVGGNDPYVAWIYDVVRDNCQGNAGYHIAVDSGYVYVVGASCTGALSSSQMDYLVLKYDKTGNLIWDKTFDGGGGRDPGASDGGGDKAYGVAVDGSGNIYATGRSYNGSNYDFWTIKLDSNGNQLWSRKINYSADYGYRVALDNQGNVYVAGYVYYGNPYYVDYAFIRKYDTNGNTIWSYMYNQYSAFLDIDIDNNNKIYLGGLIWNGSSYDYLTVKIDSDGNKIWSKNYDSGNVNEFSFGIGADSQKNVYLSGYRTAATNDALTVKYAKPCGGPFSGINFTDSTITAGQTPVKKTHFDELRWDVNVLRDNAEVNTGTGWYSFIDTLYGYLGNFTAIRSVHINEIRQKLNNVYTQCGGLPAPTYTDSIITSGQTPVRKTHVDELRQAIQNAE